MDLARYSFDVCYFSNFAFFKYFNGDLLISGFMYGGLNLAEGALADRLT